MATQFIQWTFPQINTVPAKLQYHKYQWLYFARSTHSWGENWLTVRIGVIKPLFKKPSNTRRSSIWRRKSLSFCIIDNCIHVKIYFKMLFQQTCQPLSGFLLYVIATVGLIRGINAWWRLQDVCLIEEVPLMNYVCNVSSALQSHLHLVIAVGVGPEVFNRI